MKKILISIISIIFSFGINLNAKDNPPIQKEYQSILIGLESEPIDLYGRGNYQTVSIRPREIKAGTQELANQFGAYFQSFIFTINPNHCEKTEFEEGVVCTELSSLELISKFKNNNEIALFLFNQDSNHEDAGNKVPRDYFLTDSQTKDPIHLSIEIKRSSNLPGVDKQELFLVAKDKKGIRKAKLSAILNHF